MRVRDGRWCRLVAGGVPGAARAGLSCSAAMPGWYSRAGYLMTLCSSRSAV